MTGESTNGRTLAIAGTGAIATGLARLASASGRVLVWARSGESAESCRSRLDGGAVVTTDLADLAGASFVVEAIVEDEGAKSDLLGRLGRELPGEALIATTTSSLSVEALAEASGRPDRFCGLHVFNPVEKMALVEVAFPEAATATTRASTLALCESLGKTPVEVPDVPGFVVNRLLFPFLFSAVRLAEETGLEPAAVDACMKLGAGHPMGPLKLLDLVGLDVALAIGESIGAEVPARVRELAGAGRLGRKTGRGFYEYAG